MRIRIKGLKEYRDRHGRLRRYHRASGTAVDPTLDGVALAAEIDRLDRAELEKARAIIAKAEGRQPALRLRVPDSDLLDMLNTADVCVNPDVANDMNDKSTMNKIMEYMALGKPIVQFDLTEGRVSAQRASLYARRNDEVDFARKVVELIDDPQARREMGEFGRHRVNNELEWRYEAPKLLAAYDDLFGERPAGSR